MHRNKRTETTGHDDLMPLTEQILTQMGDAGVDIRERLKKFYRRRSHHTPPIFPEPLAKKA